MRYLRKDIFNLCVDLKLTEAIIQKAFPKWYDKLSFCIHCSLILSTRVKVIQISKQKNPPDTRGIFAIIT